MRDMVYRGRHRNFIVWLGKIVALVSLLLFVMWYITSGSGRKWAASDGTIGFKLADDNYEDMYEESEENEEDQSAETLRTTELPEQLQNLAIPQQSNEEQPETENETEVTTIYEESTYSPSPGGPNKGIKQYGADQVEETVKGTENQDMLVEKSTEVTEIYEDSSVPPDGTVKDIDEKDANTIKEASESTDLPEKPENLENQDIEMAKLNEAPEYYEGTFSPHGDTVDGNNQDRATRIQEVVRGTDLPEQPVNLENLQNSNEEQQTTDNRAENVELKTSNAVTEDSEGMTPSTASYPTEKAPKIGSQPPELLSTTSQPETLASDMKHENGSPATPNVQSERAEEAFGDDLSKICGGMEILSEKCLEKTKDFTLAQLGELAGTDEFIRSDNGTLLPGNTHYFPVYEQIADALGRDQKFSILEFGIKEGNSVLFWLRAFEKCRVFGLDVRIRQSKSVDHKRLTKFYGSFTDTKMLSQLCDIGDLKLVVDDATHLLNDTMFAFEYMFPCMQSRGFYVIEDFGWSCLNRDVCEGHEFGFQKFANILHDMHGGENKAKFRGTYSPNFHIDQIRSIKSYRNFVVIEKV